MKSRVRRLIYSVCCVFSNAIGEGVIKNWIRRGFLSVRPNIPREFMINKGDTVLQIGLPSINSLKRITRLIGVDGRLLIVEPDKRNIKMIESYCKKHADRTITLVQKGAWSETTNLVFLESVGAGDGRVHDSSIVHDNDLRETIEHTGYKETVIEVDTLSNILEEYKIGRIDYLEIAINGGEVHALSGLGNEYLQNTQRIFVKGHARHKNTGQPINREISILLNNAGHRVHITKPSNAVTGDWGNRQGDVYGWIAT